MAALQLILRRTGDSELIDLLRCRTALATANIPEAAEGGKPHVAKAAAECVKILEEGRQVRKPRQALHKPVPGQVPPPHPPPRKLATEKRKLAGRIAAMGLLAVGAAIGAWLFWQGKGPRHTAAELVREMSDAASGAVIPVHVFGGQLTVTKDGATIVVVADKVPADVCVSASWVLIRKGVVAIDGTAPQRVTASQLSDLCHENDAGATLSWSSKLAEPSGAAPGH